MLHLRVVCPAERTQGVLDGLRSQPGAVHPTVARGAAVEPVGDVVEAELVREATEDVLTAVDAEDLAAHGAVVLTDVDITLSRRAEQAERAAPGQGEDAVIWDELIASTGEESRLNGTFVSFLSIACLLASVGVITNSPVTIVGAMVLGPEFGPLAAVAVGVVSRRWTLVREAALALAVGFPIALAITAAATLVARAGGLIGAAAPPGDSAVAFVYQVGWPSLIVSLLAGAAGMLAMTSSKSAVLVGVFISVTTVPSAGYAAMTASLREWSRCFEALAQLGVNLVGIVLAATVVLLVRSHFARPTERIPTGEML